MRGGVEFRRFLENPFTGFGGCFFTAGGGMFVGSSSVSGEGVENSIKRGGESSIRGE